MTTMPPHHGLLVAMFITAAFAWGITSALETFKPPRPPRRGSPLIGYWSASGAVCKGGPCRPGDDIVSILNGACAGGDCRAPDLKCDEGHCPTVTTAGPRFGDDSSLTGGPR